MEKIFISGLFLTFAFSANFSFATTYPISCPTDAQNIITALGGCSTIDCNTYSNICAKCCVKVVEPVKTTKPIVPKPIVAPTQTPTSIPIPVLKPVLVPVDNSIHQDDAVNPFANEAARAKLRDWITNAKTITTTTPEDIIIPVQEKQSPVGVAGLIVNFISGFLKFFGLGR